MLFFNYICGRCDIKDTNTNNDLILIINFSNEMKIIIKNILILISIALIVVSCDEIEAPYTKNTVIVPVDTNKPKILLEYYTAHKCNNCPAGSNAYKNLQNQYPDRVIVVAHHGTPLASPDDDGKYSIDLRNTITPEFISKYSINNVGLPCGTVSRSTYMQRVAIGYSAWGGAIQNFWNSQQGVSVNISVDASYSSSDNRISADVKLDFLLPCSEQYLVNV